MGRLKNLIRNLNYLSKHSLWDQRESDIVYLTNKILDDVRYEYSIDYSDDPKLFIFDQNDSLTLIENSPKSFVRTGDGEIKLMSGMDQPFQKYEKEIADILINIISHPNDRMYVGLNRNYFIPLHSKKNNSFYRRQAYEYRMFYDKYIDKSYRYIDATFTSYPLGMGKNAEYDQIFERWRNLFKDRNVLLVCGKGILDTFEYDIFELANKKSIISAPRINAWDEHERILREIRKNDADNLIVVFILGMAGKAMIPALADEGYMCWDVGHLAKYYNAYMKGYAGTKENISNFFAPD